MPTMHALAFSLLIVLLSSQRSDGITVEESLDQLSLSQLEKRLAQVDAEMSQLADLTLRTGLGGVGYRSQSFTSHDVPQQVRIHLGTEYIVDQVVLLPLLLRGREQGVFADGFPLAFKIVAGTEGEQSVIASLSEDQSVLPRIAPLVLDFPPVKASWIELQVTSMSKVELSRPDLFDLQLSEILVFSGTEAVSLNKPVTASSHRHSGWHQRLLTDGFTPYLMDSSQGPSSPTEFIDLRKRDSPPRLTIDLGDTFPVNQINLHSAEMILSIPQGIASNTGVPRHVKVSGAISPDHSDETLLCEIDQKSLKDLGSIIRRRFPAVSCRYINFSIIDARPFSSPNLVTQIAFSEIEVLCDGRNLAIGKSISETIETDLRFQKALPNLTDGANYYGEILPLKTWMNHLARRHQLELERPLLVGRLRTLSLAHQSRFRIATRIGLALLCCIFLTFLILHHLNKRKIATFRERIIADLHDELGANLHSIDLFCELAQDSNGDPAASMDYLKKIRATTMRSNKAVRRMSKLDESKSLFGELEADMRKAAERIVININHTFQSNGEKIPDQFDLRTRIDLLLFYKECLVNTIRHAEATELITKLSVTPKELQLEISDNGMGISDQGVTTIPPSLARRARLLKAQLDVSNRANGGTKITLRLLKRKILFPRMFLQFFRSSQQPL